MHNGTDIGVFVLGMHRSGTSAVARAVSLLGFSLGDQADLIPPGPDNPRGFWESKSLVVLNDELLSALGGSWDAPPSPSPGWTPAGRRRTWRRWQSAAWRRSVRTGRRTRGCWRRS